MKILLLNQAFHPDVVATAQHLTDLAAGLAAQGHQVTVVSSRRPYDQGDSIFPAFESWQGVRIHRVYSTRLGKRAKWRRAVDFSSFLIMASARLLFLPRHDVVVALTTPPLIAFLGAVRAKMWRASFAYWIMDFNPDEAIAAGWLRAGSFAARCLEHLSRFSLQRASPIIALDHFMRDRIIAKNIPADKISVIPPWSHDRQVSFTPAQRDDFRDTHGLEGKFLVMYSGNHSPVHPLDTLMDAAARMAAQTEVVFCFIGGGSEFSRIKKWAAGRPNVLCLPYQPLEKLSASLSAADAHVVVMGEAMLGLVHPCKIYNILAVGAPVIYVGPDRSHVTELLAELNPPHPWIGVRHGSAEELVQKICQMRDAQGLSPRPSGRIDARFSEATLVPKIAAAITMSPTTAPGSQGAPGPLESAFNRVR